MVPVRGPSVVFIEASMAVQTKAGWFYYVGRNGMLPKWLTNNLENEIFLLTMNSFGYPLSPVLGLHNKPYNKNWKKYWHCPSNTDISMASFMPCYSIWPLYDSVVPLLTISPGRWSSYWTGKAFLFQTNKQTNPSFFSNGLRTECSKTKAKPNRIVF